MTQTQNQPPQPRSLPGPGLAWLLLGLATLLRFYHLGRQSIWVDEYTSFLCANPYGTLSFADLWENLHGPLHAVAVNAMVRWLGMTTLALRLPTAIAGALTVGVVYRVAERALGRGGLLAAALAAFSPFLIWYSQEARNYAFVVLFAATATWAWVEILQTRRLAWWGVYVAACVAGILSNLSMLFVIAAHFGHWAYMAWRERRAFRAVRPWTWYVLLVVAAVSPWLWQLSQAVDWRILFMHVPASDRLERAVGMTWLAVPYTFFTFCLGFSMGPSPRELHGARSLPVFAHHLWWMIPAAVFFAWLTVRGIQRLSRRRNAFVLVMCWLFVPLVLTLYITMRNVKVFNPRYVAVSLPALFLVWTEALLTLRRRWVAWAAGVVLAAFWGAALFQHYYDPAYDKDDVRGAGAYVARHWKEGDFVLTAGAATPIRFYLPRHYPSGHFWLGFAADTVRLEPNFRRFLPPAGGRVWVVSGRPRWYDPDDNFQRFMERRKPLDRQEFLGCTVYLLGNDSSGVSGPVGR
ncbi:MAG: glycosyltransferase family 39 protein [Candidatus Eisenbacteria bacterium]|nr:glycosyltransferase family 39 protein [Candidatus Eisenbacteria bacterium]